MIWRQNIGNCRDDADWSPDIVVKYNISIIFQWEKIKKMEYLYDHFFINKMRLISSFDRCNQESTYEITILNI